MSDLDNNDSIDVGDSGDDQYTINTSDAIAKQPYISDDGKASGDDQESTEKVVDPSTIFGASGSSTLSQQTAQRKTSHYDEDNDDYYECESSSFTGKIKSTISSILPPVKIPRVFSQSSRRGSGMVDCGWSDDEYWDIAPGTNAINIKGRKPIQPDRGMGKSFSSSNSKKTSTQVFSVTDLLQMRKLSSLAVQKATPNLLSLEELKHYTMVGKRKTFLDFVSLLSVLFFVRELMLPTTPPPQFKMSFFTDPSEFLDIPHSWKDAIDLFLRMSQSIFMAIYSSKV